MNNKLIKLLVCPVCKGKLDYVKKQNEMLCHSDGLAYPIRSGVAVLLEVDARKIEAAIVNHK